MLSPHSSVLGMNLHLTLASKGYQHFRGYASCLWRRRVIFSHFAMTTPGQRIISYATINFVKATVSL